MKRSFGLSLLVVALFAALAMSNVAQADLLINGNFEAGNTGFNASSAYTYSGTTDVGPGDYGVISNPSSVGSGFFSIGDHTTGSGLMLFVDAAPASNPFAAFWAETIAVTPNTNYTLTGYGREVGSYPNSGTIRLILGTTAAGSDFSLPNGSPSGSWQQFSDNFSSGPNTSVALSLVDANPSASLGNDFVVDDLSLTPSAVPEPASLSLMAAASLPLFVRRRRASRRNGARPPKKGTQTATLRLASC
jgi:hypothetical protein